MFSKQYDLEKHMFWNCSFLRLGLDSVLRSRAPGTLRRRAGGRAPSPAPSRSRNVNEISAKCRSFSAVSVPIFTSKYAFCSIFQNLPDYLAEFFEIWLNFAKIATFANFLVNFHKIADFSNRFFAKILRLQRCKSMQIL